MATVAVVILNYNGKPYLEKFLPSVVQHSRESQVFVADNASADGSVAYVQTHFPGVRLIQLDANYGFTTGYNKALQQVTADYYLLLNSDVEVTPGWLAPLLALMESDVRIAACQPKIKSYYRKTFFEYAGAGGGMLDKYGYPFCRGRLFDTIEEDQGQYDDTTEVFWATGACLMVRAKTYWQTGGLDDYFFAHMEEIDLCWRMQQAGYRIMYCGASTVYHVGGGTLPRSNPRKTFLNFQNGLLVLYKNLPPEQLWQTLLVRLVLDGLAALRFLLAGSGRDCMAVFQAHLAFYRNFGRFAQQRKTAARTSGQFTGKLLYRRSIVYAYFMRRKKTFGELDN